MAEQIKAWPNNHAPVQNVPLTSSDERMHVMDENCWCAPLTLLINRVGPKRGLTEIVHQLPQ